MLVRDKKRLMAWIRKNICSENRLITLGSKAWILTTWHPPHRGPEWMPRPQWDAIRGHIAQMPYQKSRSEALARVEEWLVGLEVTEDGYIQQNLL